MLVEHRREKNSILYELNFGKYRFWILSENTYNENEFIAQFSSDSKALIINEFLINSLCCVLSDCFLSPSYNSSLFDVLK